MTGKDLARQGNELTFRGNQELSARRPDNNIRLQDIPIKWRNFEGRAVPPYNAVGQRNFVLFLTDEMGAAFRKLGFNVKHLDPQEEGGTGQDFVKVNVRVESDRPPKVFLVNSKGKRLLEPDMYELADVADVETIDVLVNRYERTWQDGRTTVTPYLQTIMLFLREDELEQAYAHIPDLHLAGSQDSVQLYEAVTTDDDIEVEFAEIVED